MKQSLLPPPDRKLPSPSDATLLMLWQLLDIWEFWAGGRRRFRGGLSRTGTFRRLLLLLTQSRNDDAQRDQRPVDVGALRQPVPAAAGVGSLAAGRRDSGQLQHASTRGQL